MFKRLKKLGFLLVLGAVGFLFNSTNIGNLLGHKILFYIGLFLIVLCFLVAIKTVGLPPVVTAFLKKHKKFDYKDES